MKALSQRQIRWLCFKARFRHRYVPPKGFNHARLELCRFRTRFYALSYGGYGGHGIRYEWLGLCLKIGVKDKPVSKQASDYMKTI